MTLKDARRAHVATLDDEANWGGYEYCLIRYMHDPAGGEFVNVGVVLYDTDLGKAYVRMNERYARLTDFFPDVDGVKYRSMARHVYQAFVEADTRMQTGHLFRDRPASVLELVDEVLGNRTYSAFQVSEPRSGIAPDAGVQIASIFEEFVLQNEEPTKREKREESAMRTDVDHQLRRWGMTGRVRQSYVLSSRHYRQTFHVAWRGATPRVLEPITFDLQDAENMADKANRWSGRLYNLAKGGKRFEFFALVAPPADNQLRSGYEDAVALLRDAKNVGEIYEDTDQGAERVLALLKADLEEHPNQRLP
jgi:hypothetical protein